ncbi:hypothetical protein ANN_25175 [Periplaneta americana]|uniref:Uncharacterized protein n=1 Tax=Periplaneta americana TaxID=6978 RepID=A0ABQ8S0M3_PERAM|nr:hypothetical protein ANN_25175 [Periplaneta americana]
MFAVIGISTNKRVIVSSRYLTYEVMKWKNQDRVCSTELVSIVRSRNMFAFSSDERAFNIESYFRTDYIKVNDIRPSEKINTFASPHISQFRSAVASRSKASRLGLALVRFLMGKKFSHEISASVWDRCPPSIVMHLGNYDRLTKFGCEYQL